MKYLALDNALAVTGWAKFEDKKLIEYGTFKTKSTDPIEKRLSDIFNYLDDIYKDWKFEELFFEDCQQQSNRNAQTFHKLSMVKGMILYWCYCNNIKYVCSSPSHWRSILKENAAVQWGRSRTVQKAAAKQYVLDTFNVKATEDESDAISLGMAAIIEKRKTKSAF